MHSPTRSSRRSSIRSSILKRTRGIRVLGVDDAPFTRSKTRNVTVAGVVYRGCQFIEGFQTTRVVQDGWDATRKLSKMVQGRFVDQVHLILLKGITLAGLNVVDIEELFERTGKPVLVIMRSMPDFQAIEHAVSHLANPVKRMRVIRKAGEISREGPLYIQRAGLSQKDAREILPLITARGNIPEALRVAHIIAGGLARGESKGRA